MIKVIVIQIENIIWKINNEDDHENGDVKEKKNKVVQVDLLIITNFHHVFLCSSSKLITLFLITIYNFLFLIIIFSNSTQLQCSFQ